MRNIHIVLAALLLPAALPAASYYTLRLDDPKAVYLTPANFPVHADGLADDSDALQQAIDKVQSTTNQGIVFVPQGRYRLTKTIYIWPGIRVIGYGAERPAFILAANTPGYQDPATEKLMIFFAGRRPAPGSNAPPPDANPGTFYSALSNIDVEIGEGNGGAVAVRAHYAQHCFLAHMDMHLGSALAGIHEGGNVVEDVKFYGGRYAIWTATPSPGWQLTIVDAVFENQREAAIRERAAGLTLIRPHFKNVPTTIDIDAGFPDELWVKNARMENISGPSVIVSLEKNPRTEINMENVVCQGVPVFALFRDSGRKTATPGNTYEVKAFSHGLSYSAIGAAPQIRDIFETAVLPALPAPFPSDLPDLPARDTWVNIRSLGAQGDGVTDDTAAFRKAIAAHRAIYLPSGNYIVTGTLALQPDTVLIGLHPGATQIDLLDNTPAFQGVGAPKPLIEAPKGGTNIMIGIGLYTNGVNPRAVAAKWMSGKDSLMNDVRFLGGHGTNKLDGTRENPYNNTHTADPDLRRRWDAQYPSLWVTDGGGGTFLDIWTPSTFAQAGMLISNTSTEGRVYEMSSEHHVRHEIQVHNASNWQIYALQTEEERGEGGLALPLEIDSSSNITVANFHLYRVISTYQPFPYAVKVSNSKNIRFRNFHCYSNSKVSFDSAIYDQTHNLEIRQREFAWLTISGNAPQAHAIVGPKVEKLAGGFYNISGGAIDPAGDFYFVDAHWQRIYRWSTVDHQLSTVRDNPLDPVNLAFDKSGNLLVASYTGNGTVYSFNPSSPDDQVTILKPVPSEPRPGATPVLAVSDWRLQIDPDNRTAAPRPFQYLSPDGTTFLSAGDDFVKGAMSWGVKSADLIRGFGLAPATAGKPFYMTDEAEMRTWSATVGPDGSLSNLKLFAEQGGEGVTTDEHGNVYIAAGQIYVYNPAGYLINTIEVPERPLQLVFGGKDRRTLFIPARTSLYAVRLGTSN